MIPEYFAIIGAIINFLGGVVYAVQTLRGRTKPNRVTWALWSLAPTVAFLIEISSGKPLALALSTLSVGLGPFAVLVASFLNKKAYWRINRFDIACGVLSIVAFGFFLSWKFIGAGSGVTALLLSILADFMAGLPSLVKTYRHPETEHYSVYLLSSIAMILTLGAINDWSFTNYAFPAFILIDNLVFLLFIFGKIGVAQKSKN